MPFCVEGAWEMGALVWLVLAVVLGAIELMSTTFILLWVAIAALVTGLLGLLVHSFVAQLGVFAVLSVVLLLLTRPLVRRWRNAGAPTYQSNVQRLVGEQGIVVTRLAGGKAGMVRVGNDVWSARGELSDIQLEPGERVRIVAVRSALLIVSKITQGQQH